MEGHGRRRTRCSTCSMSPTTGSASPGYQEINSYAVETGATIPLLQSVQTLVRKKNLAYTKYGTAGFSPVRCIGADRKRHVAARERGSSSAQDSAPMIASVCPDRPPAAGFDSDPVRGVGAAVRRAARPSGRSGGDVAAAERHHRRDRSQAAARWGSIGRLPQQYADLAAQVRCTAISAARSITAAMPAALVAEHAAGDHRAGRRSRWHHCRHARPRAAACLLFHVRGERGRDTRGSISASILLAVDPGISVGAVLYFAVRRRCCHLLPFTGRLDPGMQPPHGSPASCCSTRFSPAGRDIFWSALTHLVLPRRRARARVLARPSCACCARACSTSTTKTTSAGAAARLQRAAHPAAHALKNAVLPTLTLMGVQFGFLFGGTLLVEVIYLLSRARQSDGRRGAQRRSADHPDWSG